MQSCPLYGGGGPRPVRGPGLASANEPWSLNTDVRITNLAYLGVRIPEEDTVGDDRESRVMKAIVERQVEMARMGLPGAGREGPKETLAS